MEDQEHKQEIALINPSENPTNSDVSLVTNNSDASLVTNNGNNGNDAYFDSFPAGYRFKPHDEELVVHYLHPKVFNKPLPPNRIKDVELYKYNPETLAAKYSSHGEKEWYFFTPRDRKYLNGERPNRAAIIGAAGDVYGYWKATGADKPIKFNDVTVGFRKALVFYKGKAPKGDKTDWIMHEYRVINPPKRRKSKNDMRLDDWVLCRIYKKADKSIKASTRPRDKETQTQQSENGIPTQCQDNGCMSVDNTQSQQSENGIPTQYQKNGCMSVDNSAMVRREAFMPKFFDMKANFNHERRPMRHFNAYGNVTSYQSSFPRVPYSYDPTVEQTSVFAQHIMQDYENPIAMVESSSSNLTFLSMETHMKHERYNEYQQDELSSLPELENYDLSSNLDNFDQLLVNMDNDLPMPYDDGTL